MFTEQQQIEAAIAAIESQRVPLGDAVVDTALAPLRVRLAGLAKALPLELPAPCRSRREFSGNVALHPGQRINLHDFYG